MKLTGAILSQLIESTLNGVLKLDLDHETLVRNLKGKTLQVDLNGWPFSLTFVPMKNRFSVWVNAAQEADVIVSGTVVNLIRLGLTDEPNKLIHEKLVSVDGNMNVLQQYQRLMKQLNFDWEGWLGRIVGPSAAHEVMRPMKKAKEWHKNSCRSTQKDITEYLQEEKKLLPPREMVEDFYDDLSELQLAIDRLEAKIKTLN